MPKLNANAWGQGSFPTTGLHAVVNPAHLHRVRAAPCSSVDSIGRPVRGNLKAGESLGRQLLLQKLCQRCNVGENIQVQAKAIGHVGQELDDLAKETAPASRWSAFRVHQLFPRHGSWGTKNIGSGLGGTIPMIHKNINYE